jgi:hypothetical protein
MNTKSTYTGGCYCGAIRYEFTADREELMMFKCHCRDCQRLSGGPYTPVVYIPATAGRLAIVCGQVKRHLTVGEKGPHQRGFCADCGSRLTGGESSHGIAVTASSLDDPSLFQPTAETWLCDAQPWDPPLPGLPRFDKYATAAS